MTDPVLTVVIPTHDRRGLLPDTVASVLAERSLPLEVVVVDDASSDGTFDWLGSVDDPRLVRLRLDPGRGGAAARNVGLERVRSDLVMFLDDDDLIRPGALAKLVGALRRHPEAAAAGGTYVTFGTLPPGDLPRRQVMTRFPVTRPVWREQLWGWNLQPGAGVWRTAAVRAVGGWDETLRRCEDTDVNLRGLAQHPVALIPDTVLLYRQHPGQVGEEITRLEWALDDEVRERFVATLGPHDRRVGERILESRPVFKAAMRSYDAGDFATARRGLAAAYRIAPELLRSPILGPWMLLLLAKASAASVAPPSLRQRVQAARRGARARKLGRMGAS